MLLAALNVFCVNVIFMFELVIIHHRFLTLQNEYMKDDFMIKIETWHKPDMGTIENVSELKT